MDSEKVDSLEDHFREVDKQKFRARLFTTIEICTYIVAVSISVLSTYHLGETGWKSEIKNIVEYNGEPAYRYPLTEYLSSTNFILSLTPAIVPILFTLIFGYMPLAYIRRNFTFPRNRGQSMFDIIETIKQETSVPKELQTLESYYAELASKSEKLTKNIYNRGSAYLFIGGIIAIGGLVYFSSSLTPAISGKQQQPLDMTTLLPRFGALLFLEFLAFFFLKQYRFTMDDFRYYEGLQRIREEKLFYIKALSAPENHAELFGILKAMETPDLITNGASSLILESKKLHKEEFEIISKVLDKINIGR